MLSWWREVHLQIYMLHVAKMEALDNVVRSMNEIYMDTWRFSENPGFLANPLPNLLLNAPGRHNW